MVNILSQEKLPSLITCGIYSVMFSGGVPEVLFTSEEFTKSELASIVPF
jgi:hypothetical protein